METLNVALYFTTQTQLTPFSQLEDRTSSQTMSVVASQLDPVLSAGLDWSLASIAYEPVWAIGTGKTATPAMAQETHSEIRSYVSSKLGASVASSVRIQYGGSMKAANAAELLKQPDIDGGLIGGASLKPEFGDVWEFCGK